MPRRPPLRLRHPTSRWGFTSEDDIDEHPTTVWPPSATVLSNRTLCPACFTTLDGTTCPHCGLRLVGPVAARLAENSDRLLAVDLERRALIDQLRLDMARQDAEAADEIARLSSLLRAAETGDAQAAPPPASPLPSLRPPTPPRSTRLEKTPSGRSGVQVLLLTVGIVLVSVTAVFFSLVAFLVTSAGVRSGLLLLVVAAVLGIATRLHRRLPGTAEGLGVLAAVLLGLDGLLIRSQGLFGSGRLDPLLFVGIFGAGSAVALLVTSRLTGLHSLVRASLVALPLAALGLASGLAADSATRFWAGGAAAAAVWIVPTLFDRSGGSPAARLARDRTDRAWIRVTSTGPLVVSTLAAFALPGDAALGWVVPLLVSVALFMVLAIRGVTGSRSGPGRFASAAAGVTLALLPFDAAVRAGLDTAAAWILPLSIALVVLAFALASRAASERRPVVRAALARASWSGLVVLAVVATVLSVVVAGGVSGRLVSWSDAAPFLADLTAASRAAPSDEILPLTVSALGLALAALGAATAVALLRPRPAVRRAVTTTAEAVLALALVGAALSTSLPPGDLTLTALVGGLALAAFRDGRVSRGVSGTTVAVAAGLLFAQSPLTQSLWIPALLLLVSLLVGLRVLSTRSLPKATARIIAPLVTLAVSLVVVTAALRIPAWLAPTGGDPGGRAATACVILTAIVSLLVVATAPIIPLLRRAPLLDLRVVSATAVAALAVAGVVFGVAPSGTGLAAATLLALVAITAFVWLVVPAPERDAERLAAAFITPAAVIASADRLLNAGSLVYETRWLLLAVTVLGLAIASRVLLRGPSGSATSRRFAWDAPLVAAGLVTSAAALFSAPAWPTLAVLAIAALVIASTPGSSPLAALTGAHLRHHVAWAAPVLAITALWSVLADAGVTVVEAYSLPLAALLALLALGLPALALRFAHGSAPHPAHPHPVFPLLFGVGVATALLPSIIASPEGPLVRPILVIAAATLAGIAATTLGRTRVDVRTTLAAGSVVGIVATGLTMALGSPAAIAAAHPDAWSSAAALLALGIAVLWSRDRGDSVDAARDPRRRLRAVAPVFAVVAVAVFALPELVPLLSSLFGAAVDWQRPVTAVVALAVCCLASALGGPARARSGLAIRLRQAALVAASAIAAVALLGGLTESVPFETVTAPVAVAALVSGALRLGRDTAVGSWRALGFGILVLLLPGLLADYVDVQTPRLVAVGVLAVASLLAGARLRLQAPLLVGGGVAVLHAIAQLWPGLVLVTTSVPWWLWAGVGGVLLIVVAATYERRVRDARMVGRTVSSLR
ncbi:hypothetical protein EDF39_0708 [Frondihabitans sp. PhB161]|nr:hypothetical protein EDF37_0707 [Frondihabitans sp. PhB153]RPF08318.1 hypothetical protein EDF39_0708 [Frondihabitans sp. PhB161]